MKRIAHTCPYCLTRQDAVTALAQSGDELAPEPGDFGLCIDCGHWFAFADPGTRPLTPEERAETVGHPLLDAARRLTGKLKARRLQ